MYGKVEDTSEWQNWSVIILSAVIQYVVMPDAVSTVVSTVEGVRTLWGLISSWGDKQDFKCMNDIQQCCEANDGHICQWGEEEYCISNEFTGCCPVGVEYDEGSKSCVCPNEGQAIAITDAAGNLSGIACCPKDKYAVNGDAVICCGDGLIPVGKAGNQICCREGQINVDGECQDCPTGKIPYCAEFSNDLTQCLDVACCYQENLKTVKGKDYCCPDGSYDYSPECCELKEGYTWENGECIEDHECETTYTTDGYVYCCESIDDAEECCEAAGYIWAGDVCEPIGPVCEGDLVWDADAEECVCPDGGVPSSDNPKVCCKDVYGWDSFAQTYNWVRGYCGCPDGGTPAEEDPDFCCKDGYGWSDGDRTYNYVDGYCGCPDGGTPAEEWLAACCKNGYRWSDGDYAYTKIDPYYCGCPDGYELVAGKCEPNNPCPEGADSVDGICCKDGYEVDSNGTRIGLNPELCSCPENYGESFVGDDWFCCGDEGYYLEFDVDNENFKVMASFGGGESAIRACGCPEDADFYHDGNGHCIECWGQGSWNDDYKQCGCPDADWGHSQNDYVGTYCDGVCCGAPYAGNDEAGADVAERCPSNWCEWDPDWWDMGNYTGKACSSSCVP